VSSTDKIILGIESSCDETAAALVRADRTICAHQIASSAEIHASYGGVVPEIAARQHLDIIDRVIKHSFDEAGLTPNDIDGVAATGGPGPYWRGVGWHHDSQSDCPYYGCSFLCG
jgi:N6-L-threonylcarbamoyladenine synthase